MTMPLTTASSSRRLRSLWLVCRSRFRWLVRPAEKDLLNEVFDFGSRQNSSARSRALKNSYKNVGSHPVPSNAMSKERTRPTWTHPIHPGPPCREQRPLISSIDLRCGGKVEWQGNLGQGNLAIIASDILLLLLFYRCEMLLLLPSKLRCCPC